MYKVHFKVIWKNMKALVRCHHKNIFAALSSRHIKSEMVSSLSKKKKNTLLK